MPQLVRGASREGGKNLNQEVQTKKPGEREREKKRVFLQRNTECKSHVLNDVPDEECTSDLLSFCLVCCVICTRDCVAVVYNGRVRIQVCFG